MRTFVLILTMLAATLVAQDKQTQKTEPPQITVQPESEQASQTEAPTAVQQPQTVFKTTANPAQLPPPQQLITFTAEKLEEHENKVLDRAETFYNNRMNHLLWVMGLIMAAGLAIVGILIPMILEWQRKRTFAKELTTHLSKSEDALKTYAEEQTQELRAELTKDIYSSLSIAFLGLGASFLEELSPAGYALTLQLDVLAMKFYIISQCSGACLTASQIIKKLTHDDRGSEITPEDLKVVDEEIENMREDVDKIIDDEKRADMKSQVKDLQIFVHGLIYKKQQSTDVPPDQAGPQQS